LFDHKNDFSGSTLVWVKFPNLLMEFWSKMMVHAIGYLLGKTILVNEFFLTYVSHFVVRVLVEIDVSKCLFESLYLF